MKKLINLIAVTIVAVGGCVTEPAVAVKYSAKIDTVNNNAPAIGKSFTLLFDAGDITSSKIAKVVRGRLMRMGFAEVSSNQDFSATAYYAASPLLNGDYLKTLYLSFFKPGAALSGQGDLWQGRVEGESIDNELNLADIDAMLGAMLMGYPADQTNVPFSLRAAGE
jgi:hypothetical protein